METGIIKKSVTINATPIKIWEVLTEPSFTRQWGNEFSEGAYVETDWKKGSEVLWKDKEGDVGAKGIVQDHMPASTLRIAYYDDVNQADPATVGDYMETYLLTPGDGHVVLRFEAGPLADEYLKSHDELWDKAIRKITELAQAA